MPVTRLPTESKGDLVNPSTRDLAAPVTRLQPRPPDLDWLNRLPQWDRLDLEAHDTAPKKARRRLMSNLEKWSLQRFETSAPFVLSEIVTNAVAATNVLFKAYVAAGGAAVTVPEIVVWLGGGPSVVALLTWDASIAPPERRHAGDYDENGRGLMIIEDLSADYGYYYPDGFGGKITWAIINRP
jgi:hypothetical protein